MDRWDEDAPSFEEAGNPVSGVYSGRMVDAARIFCWAWDARPFPAFPQLDDLWADGANWLTGHWLNGRLSGVDLGALVDTVLDDHGLQPADTALVDGTLDGYLVTDIGTARDALEPLARAFALRVTEKDGALCFAGPGIGGDPVDPGELVCDDEPLLTGTRTAEHDLPTEVTLGFADLMRDYQSVTARAAIYDAGAERQQALGLPAVLDAELGTSLADDLAARPMDLARTSALCAAAHRSAGGPGFAHQPARLSGRSRIHGHRGRRRHRAHDDGRTAPAGSADAVAGVAAPVASFRIAGI